MGQLIDKWTSEMIMAGISSNHIEAMKDRILVSNYEYNLFYDKVSKDKEQALVDVKKIKGINTGWTRADKSIYELFFSVTGELSSTESLHRARIQTNFNSLIKNGIEYQYEFYVDATKENLLRDGLPCFNYYLEDDLYISEATHRTVSAIMFNAPKMVGYVITYKRNETKYKNYLKHNKTLKKWILFLTSEFKCIDIIEVENGDYEIRLKNYKVNFKFEIPLIKPSNGNLINTMDFEREQKEMLELIQKLQDIDNALSTKKLGDLPLPLRVIKKPRFFYLVVLSLYYDKYYNYGNFIDIDNTVNDIVRKIENKARFNAIEANLKKF